MIEWLLSFKIVFLGIFLEALPFILIGAVLSSLIHIYLPERWIKDHMPKNPLLGILYAIAFGFIFPICECGIVPVIKRLIQKGMPSYMAVVTLAVGPIFNPVVILATYTAFGTKIEMVILRIGLGIIIGALLGIIFYLFFSTSSVLAEPTSPFKVIQQPMNMTKPSLVDRLREIFTHALSEFMEMGTYLIIGCFITAIIQLGVPREWIAEFGFGPFAHLFMMGLAYILSLCSTSDAFIGMSLWNTVEPKAILTFLVFGPMIDFKGTLMLLSAFKVKFVMRYILFVCLLVIISSFVVDALITL